MATGARQDVKGKGRARVVGRPRARSKTRAERPKLLEEDPAIAERVLCAQLKGMGLYAAHTIGDGNCLFRAVSDQMYGHANAHLQLRHEVCEYIDQYPDKFRLFVDEDSIPGGFEGHVASMRLQGTYGTHIELSALAHLFRRPIKVVQPGLVYVIAADEGAAPEDSNVAEPEAKMSAADPRAANGAETGPLYIVYHSWEHYSSLRNLSGPHAGLPKIREIIPPPPAAEPEPEPSPTPTPAPAPAPSKPAPSQLPSTSKAVSPVVTPKLKKAKAVSQPPPLGEDGLPIKRGRGRPRKYPIPVAPADPLDSSTTSAAATFPLDPSTETAVSAPSLSLSLSLSPSSSTPPASQPELARSPSSSTTSLATSLGPLLLSALPPIPYPPPQSLSEHLQRTLTRSPSAQRSRHESAEESSQGSTPVGSLSSGSSVSSEEAAEADHGDAVMHEGGPPVDDGSAPMAKRGPGRPRKVDGGVKGPTGREKRERRMEEKRRKAEMRRGAAGGSDTLRRSKRGLAEPVLGEVRELYI